MVRALDVPGYWCFYEMGDSFSRTEPGKTLKGTGYRHQIPLDAWTAPWIAGNSWS
jgi:hypothetical protein